MTPVAVCVDLRGARRAREGLGLLQGSSDGTAGDWFAEFGPAPISASLSNVRLVADARIDNLDELRGALNGTRDEAVGYTLIRAYLAWGPSFADRLIGDFAIVLWDGNKSTVIAARDPFGVRPLFYSSLDGRLWLSSSVRPLLGTLPPGTQPDSELDDEAVVQYLLWRCRTPSTSFYRSIRDVPAGHVLLGTSESMRQERYWHPPEPHSDLERAGREEIFEELRRLFRSAVERRLRSSAPVVIHVSGGLDSSSIAMAANELAVAGRAPRLVGAAAMYPGLACDESPYVDAVASAVTFPIERWDGMLADCSDLTEPLPEAPGARIATTSGTSGDLEIAERHGAKTILSGLGGDDLMTISGITRDLVTAGQWRAAWASLTVAGFTSADARRRLRKIASQFIPARLLHSRARGKAAVPEWLQPRFHEMARDIIAAKAAAMGSPQLTSVVRTNMWSRVNAAALQGSIGALQRVSLSRGVEFRFPYLDRELVTFVLRVPSSNYPGLVPTARLHREPFRPMLPRLVAERTTKADLTPAVRNRVERALPQIGALLSEDRWASRRFVNSDGARRALDTVAGRPQILRSEDWWRIWRIATVETWTRAILLYGMSQ